MDGFELNKMAGAVLLAGIIAMGTGLLARNLVPEPHGGHGETAVAAAGHAAGAARPAAGGAPAAGAAPAGDVAIGPLLAAASVDEGKAVARKCAACHTFEKGGANKVGPNLYGVVGADKAHLDGFAYSSALADAPGEWSYEDLNKFLTKPTAFLPGTKMSFAGLSSAEDRADVIAYMRSMSDNPPPLPEAGQAAQPAGDAATSQPAAATAPAATAPVATPPAAAPPAAAPPAATAPAATPPAAAPPAAPAATAPAATPPATPERPAPTQTEPSAQPVEQERPSLKGTPMEIAPGAAPAAAGAAPATPAEPAPAQTEPSTQPVEQERPSLKGTPMEIAPSRPETEAPAGGGGAPAPSDTPATGR